MRQGRAAVIITPTIALIAAGFAWAGSQNGTALGDVPLFALGIGLTFVVQWAMFVPAFIRQSERFYDLTGSFTYISTILLAAWLSAPIGHRSMLLVVLVMVWAGRLGVFLFRRILRAGRDERFDEIKPSFVRFLNAWTIQALWITLTMGAALAAITSGNQTGLDSYAIAGICVWLLGFSLEATADLQKNRFRANPANRGRFIHTGLWSWSRHPNYFGEITLWTGVAIIAYPALSGWQLATLISPLFVLFLLTRVSGVPLLEKMADDTWGGEPAYETYKSHTSVLVPLPPRSRNASSAHD